MFLLPTVIFVIQISCISCRKDGAPEEACVNMTPGHGVKPQQSDPEQHFGLMQARARIEEGYHTTIFFPIST